MISVLGDDVGPLQRAARRRLIEWGAIAVPMLQEGGEAEHLPTRLRCRAVLRAIERRDIVRRFGGLALGGVRDDESGDGADGARAGGPDSAVALLEGAVLAARLVRTFVPPSGTLLEQLRRHADPLRREFAGRSLPARARLLSERLLAGPLQGGLGLRGGDVDNLDIDHVLIDRVLARGVGAPISLSLIYLLVARHAGLSAAGVAMPDHFLIRLHGPRPLLLDPFHGGRVIPKADCARYLRRNGHRNIRGQLRDLGDREVLAHYLRSLRRASPRRAGIAAGASLREALEQLEAR